MRKEYDTVWKGDWSFEPVEKRGGLWGWFETHTPSGRSRFVAFNTTTKREAIQRREEYISNGRK